MICFRQLLSISVSIIAFLISPQIQAQSKITVSGNIYNGVTSKRQTGATVEILSSDSITVGSQRLEGKNYVFDESSNTVREEENSYYRIAIPKVEGDYFIKVSLDGYQTVYKPVSLKNLGSRQSEYEVPNIYLRPEAKVNDLGEVVVKASKVKFYNKGDTIVYNADAFQLPEGSMLDALVKQLPGVEIKDGGAIYVNGRYVESLLLNGKDFFNGNNEVMLDNLGAYLVKDIQVYEKGGNLSEMMGKKLIDDTQYVMDVKIKKDYMAGNLLNLIGSGGTSSRYLGKIFGMHYTNNSRVALYGNVNNLNDSDKPNDGRGYQMYSGGQQGGLTDTYRGGIDYFADNPLHTWELSGNADFSFNKNTNDRDNYVTTFLPAGNIYDYSFYRPVRKNLGVSTSHKIRVKKDMWELDINPSFHYNHDKNESKNTAASFKTEIDGISSDMIADMFNKNNEQAIGSLVNRNMTKDSGLYHGINANLFTEFFYKIKKSSDLSSIWVSANFKDYRNDRDNFRDIVYGDNPTIKNLQKQMYDEVPNKNFNLNVGTKYYFNIKNGTTGFLYNFNHEEERKRSELYLLEARVQTGDISFDFDGMEPVFDPGNSYTSRLIQNYHQIRPFYTQGYTLGKGSLDIKISPEISFYNRHLDYHRGDIDVSPKKSEVTLRIMDTFLRWMTSDYKWHIMAGYDRTPSLASLVDMVDMKDTSDPLNIMEGNPDLKNSINNKVYMYVNNSRQRGISQALNFSYGWTENDLVRGYRYDSESGVRTYKTYNVSGNNNLNLSYMLYGRLPGVMNKFILNSSTAFTNSVYANMIGENSEPVKQKVRNTGVSETMNFIYDTDKITVGPNVYVYYRHTKSAAEMFDSFNAFDFSYGLTGNFRSDKGFGIGTEITMNSRRGYSQSEMNDNVLLWNAWGSYSMLKGALLFRIKANDILAQTKGISYSVNAQGRTETRYQTLPRYVTLTVEYKFDFRPKRERRQNNN